MSTQNSADAITNSDRACGKVADIEIEYFDGIVYRTKSDFNNGFSAAEVFNFKKKALGYKGWHPPFRWPIPKIKSSKPTIKRVVREYSADGYGLKALRAAYGDDLVNSSDRTYYRVEKFCLNGEIVSTIRTYVLEWSDGKVIEARAGRLRSRCCLRRAKGEDSGQFSRSGDGLRGGLDVGSFFH
jgi:hypothetical protein